jgi:thioredoxin reductase
MSQYDVAVIGGGPAGLSAALVLARAGSDVVVVDAGSLRNAPASHLHGYLSRDGQQLQRDASWAARTTYAMPSTTSSKVFTHPHRTHPPEGDIMTTRSGRGRLLTHLGSTS